MARLVIFDDRMRGVDLPSREVVIGRSRRADVPIQDGLLSRKHCSIVPVGVGYRLFDLKSQNGTYLNGGRVSGSKLEFDDIIEVGRTVLVFLDTETWNRGEGLARLRNPLKAQELIQKINRGPRGRARPYPVTDLGEEEESPGLAEGAQSGGRLASGGQSGGGLAPLEQELLEYLEGRAREPRLSPGPSVGQFLEDYLVEEVSRAVVSRSPGLCGHLRALTNELLEQFSSSGGDLGELRDFARKFLSGEARSIPRGDSPAPEGETAAYESPTQEEPE